MPSLERFTRTAATVSVVLILAVQIAFHPDVTLWLRVVAIAAFAGSWLAAPRFGGTLAAIWIVAAPLAPALVRTLTAREGTIADLIWLAGLAGTLTRTSWRSPWSLPRGWAALVGGWSLLLAMIWPVLLVREIGFQPIALTWTAVVAAAQSAPHVIRWTLYVIVTRLVAVLWLEWTTREASERQDLPLAADALWFGTTLSSIVAIYQGTVGLGFVNGELWTFLGRATGTMLDGNAYGLCAALAGPFGFTRLRGRGGVAAQLAPLVLLLNVAGLWMSSSRTAFLCGIAAIAGLALAESRRREASLRRPVIVTIAASLIIVGLLAMTATAIGPIRRLIELPDKPSAALASLWRREGYGTVAMRMIREYPAMGIGIGSYRDLAPDYWSEVSNIPLPPDNAQNWWRHQAAESGIVGSLPVFAISAAVLWLLVMPTTAVGQRSPAIVARALLVGIGLSSLFGVPTIHPVVLLWFFTIVAWLLSMIDGGDLPIVTKHLRAVWIAGLVIALAYAAVHIALARRSLSPLARATRWHHQYVAGAYPPEPAEGAGEFRWTRDNARFVWPVETRWVVLQVFAGHPDIARMPVQVTIADRCGAIFDELLRTPNAVRIGFAIRDGERTIDLTTHVSRTWRPVAFGGTDPRTLGLGVKVDFVHSEDEARSVDHWVQPARCP